MGRATAMGWLSASAFALAAVGASAADWDHRHMQSYVRGSENAEVTLGPGDTRVGRVIVAPANPSASAVPDSLARVSQRQWVQGPLSSSGASSGKGAAGSREGSSRGGTRHNGTPGAHGAPKGSAPQGQSSGSR